MNVGTNIKYFRRLNSLSQKELGEKVGVSNKTICSWEINRTEPDMEHFDLLCKALGCSRNQLITGSTTNDIPPMAPDAIVMLDLYNRANEEQRKAVLNLLRSLVPEDNN